MRAHPACRWLIYIALAWAALAQDARPQSPDTQPGVAKDDKALDEKKYDIPYWERSESFQIRAAVAVIGEGNLPGALGARVAISENVPTVRGWEFYFDKALPIHRSYLDAIRDGRVLPDMRARELIDLNIPDRGLYLAYLQALRRSHSATEEMFRNSAEENRKAAYSHLAADPKYYRGKIITVTGKLTAIRAVEAPPLVQGDGIREIYTSWIVGPTRGAPPFAIVFTQLPAELEVSEKLNAEVTFQGYFLSNILIPADKERGVTRKNLICPWLIGQSLVVTENRTVATTPIAESTASYDVALYTVGVIAGIAVLLFLLNFYVRRSDSKTQSQLAKVRERHQSFSLEDGETPEKEPSEPPG